MNELGCLLLQIEKVLTCAVSLVNTPFATNIIAILSFGYYKVYFLPQQSLMDDYKILVGNKFLYITPTTFKEGSEFDSLFIKTTQAINRMAVHKDPTIRQSTLDFINIYTNSNGKIPDSKYTSPFYMNIVRAVGKKLGQGDKQDYSASYVPASMSHPYWNKENSYCKGTKTSYSGKIWFCVDSSGPKTPAGAKEPGNFPEYWKENQIFLNL